MSKKIYAEKNAPDWLPSKDDYELVFVEVDGYWRELGHNLPEYSNILLADYLSKMNLCIPDYTQFLRVMAPDYCLEYRCYGGRVRIDYNKRTN